MIFYGKEGKILRREDYFMAGREVSFTKCGEGSCMVGRQGSVMTGKEGSFTAGRNSSFMAGRKLIFYNGISGSFTVSGGGGGNQELLGNILLRQVCHQFKCNP